MAGRLNGRRARGGADRSWRRRAALVALAAAVIAIHGYVTDLLGRQLADFHLDAEMPKRLEVAYVRQLEPAAPPRAAPQPAQAQRARPRTAAAAPAKEARPPKPAQPEIPPEEVARKIAPEDPQVAEVEPAAAEPTPRAPEPAASAPLDDKPVYAEATGTSPGAPPFEWPVSTRLSYVLTGHYQGEIHGRAQVEWIRLGDRYQVHMDLTIGLPFAPLFTRAITSEGELTPGGLKPKRYDEDSKMAFRHRRRVAIRFEPYGIVLPDGHVRLGWGSAQDAASQFVQLTYLFTTQPERLAVGQRVDLALALPGSVEFWTYDVREVETLHTPFGALDAFHLVPRREPRPGGDLTAEMWFAPALAYLPVRIRIWQDAETFIDLLIDRKPQLAAR
jgi:hypothetical protein